MYIIYIIYTIYNICRCCPSVKFYDGIICNIFSPRLPNVFEQFVTVQQYQSRNSVAIQTVNTV